jgi:hypothetical protein
MIRPSIILMLSFILRSFALAAEAPQSAKHLAPFLDEQTVAIVHLDTQRLDLDALQKKLQELAANFPPQDRQAVTQGMQVAMPILKAGLADFRKAGARHAYFVFTMSDVLSSPGYAVVPLEQGADAKSIASLLFSGSVNGPNALAPNRTGWPEAAEEVKGAVVLGTRGMLKRLAEAKPQPQPAIEAALAAAPDAAVQVMLLIPNDARRVIDALWPALPREFGAVPSTVVTTGFTHATLAIELPPNSSAKFTIQAKDAQAAQALSDLLAKVPAVAANHPHIKREIPNTEAVLRALLPKVEQDRLVTNVDEAIGGKILEQFVVLMQRARIQAMQQLTSSHMRHILQGCMLHAADNKGQWPQKLDQLAPKYIPANVLKMPSGRALVYLPPTKQGPDSSTIVVMHESIDGQQPITVGFLDGHTELMTPDLLKRMLEAAQK